MCIIIRRGEHALQKRRRHEGGFTLPEVLASLAICMMLMQIAGQWSVLTGQSHVRIQQNQQAVLLAQTALAGAQGEIPEGWQVVVERRPMGEFLEEREITVKNENQIWQFYYAGETR